MVHLPTSRSNCSKRGGDGSRADPAVMVDGIALQGKSEEVCDFKRENAIVGSGIYERKECYEAITAFEANLNSRSRNALAAGICRTRTGRLCVVWEALRRESRHSMAGR